MSSHIQNLVVASITGTFGVTVLILTPVEIPGAALADIADMGSPSFFVILNGCFLLSCGLMLAIKTLVFGISTSDHTVVEKKRLFNLSVIFTLWLLYLISIYFLGMLLSSGLMMVAMAFALGFFNLKWLLPVAVIFPTVVYLLFEKTLRILLPGGVIFQ